MIKLKLKPMQKIKMSSTILMSQVADLDNDGTLEYIVATHDDYLRIFKYNEKELKEIGHHRLPMSISKFVIHDVDGDGEKEIIVGTRDKFLRILHFDGEFFIEKAIWKATDPIQDIIVGDAFNKNQPTIIVAAGKFLYFLAYQFGHLQEGDNIRQARDILGLSLADLDNDGLLEVIYGVKDNEIQMIQFQSRFYQSLKGKLRIDYYVKNIATSRSYGSNQQNLIITTANGEFGIYQFQNGAFMNSFKKKYKGNLNSMAIWENQTISPQNDGKFQIVLGGSLGEVILMQFVKEKLEELTIPLVETITNLQIWQQFNTESPMLFVACEDGILYLYKLPDLLGDQLDRK